MEINLNANNIDDELVLIQEADQEVIKKYDECNKRWQKAIKEWAKKENLV